MYIRFLTFFVMCGFFAASLSCGQIAAAQSPPDSHNPQSVTKVPSGVILVKGAWSSASDSVTPLPEGGKIADHTYRNPYLGISWTLPHDWTQKYEGPPPSDSGRYVLAQIVPAETFTGPARGSILITADDLFFTPFPVTHAPELIDFSKNNLQADYKVERPPAQIALGGRSFRSFAYWSPVAELHWYVFATQIRCHAVEIVISSRDTKLIESLMHEMNTITFPPEDTAADGTSVPVCLKDYASGENVISRIEPIFSERRFNAVPVRIIIGKDGKVKHIHFISAFPDQAKAIADALDQWSFKPYLRNGQVAEVETGILFGFSHRAASTAKARGQ
jgi:hypothetical protein